MLAYEPGRERLDARASIASDGDPGARRAGAAARDGGRRARRPPPRRPADDRRPARRHRPAHAAVVAPRPPRGRRRAARARAGGAAGLGRGARLPRRRSTAPRALSEQAYVVDLAWLRSTPWRERVAAIFDPPALRARAAHAHRRDRAPPPRLDGRGGCCCVGWLSSRLGWRDGARCVAARRRALAASAHAQPPGRRRCACRPRPSCRCPGLAGPRRSQTAAGRRAAPRPRPGRPARAPPRARRQATASGRILGASRGESGRARRGHPPGAAARPDLRARASAPARAMLRVTRLTTLPGRRGVAERAARARSRARSRRARERARRRAPGAERRHARPARTYELLGGGAGRAGEDVEVWFADERCVGPEDEESNYRLARRDAARAAPRIAAERGAPHARASWGPTQGARELRARAARRASTRRAAGLPVLDLVVLGIGPDGHIASLFPGAPTLDAGAEAICLGVHDSPKPPPERITLSLAVLRAARALPAAGDGRRARPTRSTRCSASPRRHVPASLLRRERLTRDRRRRRLPRAAAALSTPARVRRVGARSDGHRRAQEQPPVSRRRAGPQRARGGPRAHARARSPTSTTSSCSESTRR